MTNDVEVLNTLVIESGSIDYAGFDVTFESMVSIECRVPNVGVNSNSLFLRLFEGI